MSVVVAGSVSTNLAGTVLTFLDQTTGIGTFVSRTLVIYDSNGLVLTTIPMGTSTSTFYNITADQYLTFVETIVDNTGSYVLTINYLAQGIYAATFLNIIKDVGCTCNCSYETFMQLLIGELFLAAANRFAIAPASVSAQNNIVAANLYINP